MDSTLSNNIKMNNLNDIDYKSDKPVVNVVLRNEHLKIISIGLGKNIELKQHKTNVPTILTVLKGKLSFFINNNEFVLKRYDTFAIPVDVMHHVIGMKQKNLFTLTQELNNK